MSVAHGYGLANCINRLQESVHWTIKPNILFYFILLEMLIFYFLPFFLPYLSQLHAQNIQNRAGASRFT